MSPLIEPPVSSHPIIPGAATQTLAVDELSLSSPISYERPQPRPPRSPAHAAQTRVRNRRREWLSRHPSYYLSLEHELADPLLYDALIRRFQTHEQREKEGRAKGFGRVLEVDLLRGEARLSRLAGNAREKADGRNGKSDSSNDVGSSQSMESADASITQHYGTTQHPEPNSASTTYMNQEELEALEAEDLDHRGAPQTAEEGRTRWDEFLRRRFVAGGDEDFNYRAVDEDEEYDILERQEQELAWFDNEEPSWIGQSDGDDDSGGAERILTGETGIQDF
jgi:hypothetical protein